MSNDTEEKPKWRTGLYAMHSSGPVKLLDESAGRFGIRYLQNKCYRPHNDITEPYESGGSCWSVGENELRRIADPVVVLRVLLTEAHDTECRLVEELKEVRERLTKLRYALHQIKCAQDLAALCTPRATDMKEKP